jgi:hypothetical protein
VGFGKGVTNILVEKRFLKLKCSCWNAAVRKLDGSFESMVLLAIRLADLKILICALPPNSMTKKHSVASLDGVEAAEASLWNRMEVSGSSRHRAVESAFLVFVLARNLDNL